MRIIIKEKCDEFCLLIEDGKKIYDIVLPAVKNGVNIYTDGACSGNPGPGAYAAILLYKDKEKVVSGFKEQTTNQEMEISAVLNALKAVKNKNIGINLYSDSKYALDGMSDWMHGWAKKQWAIKPDSGKSSSNWI